MAKGRNGQWYASNQVSGVVSGLGWRITLAEPEVVIARGEDLLVRARIDADVLEFGVAKDFDRWANSTDFTFSVTDYGEEAIAEAVALARWALLDGLYRPGSFDTVDLRDHLRRFRRSVQAADLVE